MAVRLDQETGIIFDGDDAVAQMGLSVPEFCCRDCDDCQPLAHVITQWADRPEGRNFICVGVNDGSRRTHPGDELRHCFKNDQIDTMEDWDERDVIDTVSILMQGLSIFTNRRLNSKDGGI